jgi:hypothetical protein
VRPLIVASTPGLTVVIPPTGGFEICVAADCRITKLNLKCSSSSLLSRRRKEGIEVEAEGSGSLIIHQVSCVKQIDREDNKRTWTNSIGKSSPGSRFTEIRVPGYALGVILSKTRR